MSGFAILHHVARKLHLSGQGLILETEDATMSDEIRDWRELCRMAAEEEDGERLSEITSELLLALDEAGNERQRLKSF